MALSAALIWIFFGVILVYSSTKPVGRISLVLLRTVLVIIACMQFIEIILNPIGEHFIVESWFITIGSVLFGSMSSPISPMASVLIIIAAVGLFFCVDPAFLSSQHRKARECSVVAGIIITLAGFTLVLSYIYRNPLLYNISAIPIAVLCALCAFFIGVGLIVSAGPATIPVCYFWGNSIRARLLRNFVALSVAITLCETILFYAISSWYAVSNAIMISASLVIFITATSIIVGRVSGEIGHSLDTAEQALADKNEDISELNEELKAVEEELRQNIDTLSKTERDQRESELFLRETEKIANLGGWKANPDTNYLLLTEGIYEIIEAPRSYQPGLTEVLKYFSQEDHPLIRENLITCFTTGEPFILEVLITTETGKKVWTELRGLRQVKEGARFSVIGTFQRHNRAEANRRETQTRGRETGHTGRICPAAHEC